MCLTLGPVQFHGVAKDSQRCPYRQKKQSIDQQQWQHKKARG